MPFLLTGESGGEYAEIRLSLFVCYAVYDFMILDWSESKSVAGIIFGSGESLE